MRSGDLLVSVRGISGSYISIRRYALKVLSKEFKLKRERLWYTVREKEDFCSVCWIGFLGWNLRVVGDVLRDLVRDSMGEAIGHMIQHADGQVMGVSNGHLVGHPASDPEPLISTVRLKERG